MRCAFGPANPSLQRPQPRRQLALLAHAFQHSLNFRELAGLCQVVKHSLAHGRHGALQRRLAGDNHRLGVGRNSPYPLNHFQPPHSRHVEIDNHAVVGGAIERCQSGASIWADGGFVAQSRQFDPHQLLERQFIVGIQNSHGAFVLFQVGGSSSVVCWWFSTGDELTASSRHGPVPSTPVQAARSRGSRPFAPPEPAWYLWDDTVPSPTSASGSVTRNIAPFPGPALEASILPP